ncbi:MAG: hypothetical protein ACP5OA_07100 [Candidatus Woesearchaeota archaeon]
MIEIISIFLLIILAFFIMFWMKKTLFIFGFFFKAFGLIIITFIAVSFLFGYVIVKDADNFMNNFGNSTSMFVLISNANNTKSFISGVTINPENKSLHVMDTEELKASEKLYKYNRMDLLGADYYKVFIIDFESFEDLNIDIVEDKNINLSKDEFQRIMLSNNAKEELAKIVAKQTGEDEDDVLDGIGFDSEEIKGYIFSHYLSTTFNPDNKGLFLIQLKNDNIQVYKETALFKAIKVIPTFLIDTVTKKLFDKQGIV